MEKFYIAEEGSKLRDNYLRYLKNQEEVNEIIKKFFKTHGITTNEYYANNSYLHIVATEEDKKKFEKQLCKPKDGLYRFRANSKINKAWMETLKQHNIKVLSRPMVPFCFDKCWGGRSSSRLFEIDGVVYCSFDASWEFTPKDKLQEIKASEFFKMIEDYNEKLERRE